MAAQKAASELSAFLCQLEVEAGRWPKPPRTNFGVLWPKKQSRQAGYGTAQAAQRTVWLLNAADLGQPKKHTLVYTRTCCPVQMKESYRK